MRSKTPLALMEQVIMVLVFALAAALCLRAFVLSDSTSRACEEQDRAVMAAQTVAEAVKLTRGDYAEAERMAEAALENVDVVYFHSNHAETIPGAMKIIITPAVSDTALLGLAEISAQNEMGDEILSLTVAWQEVSGNE